jgi:hypothetical protein
MPTDEQRHRKFWNSRADRRGARQRPAGNKKLGKEAEQGKSSYREKQEKENKLEEKKTQEKMGNK